MGAKQDLLPTRAEPRPGRRAARGIAGLVLLLSLIFIVKYSSGVFSCRQKLEAVDAMDTPHRIARQFDALTFGSDFNLTVLERMRRNPPHHDAVHVSGDLVLTPVQGEGRIELHVVTNIEDLDLDVSFDREAQEFGLSTPDFIEWNEQEGPYVKIRITVSVPVGAQLHLVQLHSVHLGVRLEDGLSLTTRSANVHTVGGDVVVAPHTLCSEDVVIETVSGDVRGGFPLHSLVKIRTVSGGVGVDLWPQPSPDEAVVDISSVSGDVHVVEDLDHVPQRAYVTRMQTVSGAIAAVAAFTSESWFRSQSGDLTLRLACVPDASAHLETSSKSGRSQITIDGEARALVSKHNSLSGGISLRYPASWEGEFSMSTMTGSQEVRGEGVRYERRRGFQRIVRGEKGDGGSEMTVQSISGSQELTIGE